MWQTILDLLRTVGLGSLIGVFVGYNLTARQKRGELLRGIHASNYRETVSAYRNVRTTLTEVRDITNTITVYTDMLQTDPTEGGPSSRNQNYAKNHLKQISTELKNLRRGSLTGQVEDLAMHFDGQVQRAAIVADVSVNMLTIEIDSYLDSSTPTDLANVITAATRAEKSISSVPSAWAKWKESVEPRLAGVPPRGRVKRWLDQHLRLRRR